MLQDCCGQSHFEPCINRDSPSFETSIRTGARGRIGFTSLTDPPGPPSRVVLHTGSSAIVLAINLPVVLARAQRSNVDIEFVPQVGDFVAADEPLFHIYGSVQILSHI